MSTQASLLLPGETNADLVKRLSVSAKKKKPSQSKMGEEEFAFQCRAHQLPSVVQQFKLLKSIQGPRKDNKDIPSQWRFDFAFVEFKTIVEIDGGIWIPGGGAHSHPVDIERNMAKQNDAWLAGFGIIRFSPKQVKKGEAIAVTLRVLASRGWRRA